MHLQNSIETLRELDNLGFINYREPLWLNLSHHDPRHFVLPNYFSRHIERTDAVVKPADSKRKKDSYPEYCYIDDFDKPIPVTEIVDIPIIHSVDEAVNVTFLATARPITPQELGVPYEQNKKKRKGPPPSKKGLVRLMMENPKNGMFAPHVNGVCGSYDGDTILFYPLTAKTPEDEKFRELIARGLHMKGYRDLVVRNPFITLANRVKGALPDLITNQYLESSKDFSADKFDEFEERILDAKFDALKKGQLRHLGLRQLHFSELAAWYKSFGENGSSNHAISYFPLTIDDFGKSFEWEKKYWQTRTLPVALATMGPPGKHDGVFNYGLFTKFSVDEEAGGMSYAFWKNERFAEWTSQMIANKLGMPVIPLYRPTRKAAPTDWND